MTCRRTKSSAAPIQSQQIRKLSTPLSSATKRKGFTQLAPPPRAPLKLRKLTTLMANATHQDGGLHLMTLGGEHFVPPCKLPASGRPAATSLVTLVALCIGIKHGKLAEAVLQEALLELQKFQASGGVDLIQDQLRDGALLRGLPASRQKLGTKPLF
ncbi:hypothetical protein D3C73_874160 [compost metagenome]